MKKVITISLMLLMIAAMAIPALAADYRFASGASSLDMFGTSTSYEGTVLPDEMSENLRRNKDAAFFPPPYGIFSGDIATAPTSLFHDNLRESGFVHVDQDLPPFGDENYSPGISDVTHIGFLTPSSQTAGLITEPWLYEDGRVGTLHVERLNLTINVYEGESQANLARGAGRISSTSAWDGNVALAGHNRGTAGYFSFVRDLRIGDRLVFTTRYGARTYEVVSLTQIDEWSSEPVRFSHDNILSLVTCIANVPELRDFAVARHIG